jgi:tRNA-splicing ligase RtcB
VHGAGRVSSRNMAMKNLSGEEIKNNLSKKGIEIKTGSLKGLAAEAPEVYKDIDEVIESVTELGLNKKVAKMKPILVIKG